MRKVVVNIILSILFLINAVPLFSQGSYSCTSPTYTAQNFSNPPISSDVTIRLYLHIVRHTDGTGGQPVENVLAGICNLKNDFAPHGIYFLVQSLNYIDDDNYFNFTPPGHVGTLDGLYGHTDGIDIFIFDDQQSNYDGGTVGGEIGKTTHIFLGGFLCSEVVKHHIISHEMGHILDLFHTHGPPPNHSPPPCSEKVPRSGVNSNCTQCGDYLCDTEADPNLNFNVDPISCNWLGSGSDIHGNSYTPDPTNVMAWSCPPCMTNFSPLQAIKMKTFLANNTAIQNCIISYTAQAYSTVDLYMRDTPEDFGQSPSPGIPSDEGPDVWVRNSNDGLSNQFSEPLTYNNNLFYAYVRVINRSCSDFPGGGTLDLHWSKFGTAQSWPKQWNGFLPNNGNIITSLSIPAIPAGESYIFEIPWDMSNHLQTSTGKVQACLLARINNVVGDPLTQNADLYSDVKNENNLTLKNVVIRDAAFFKMNNWVNAYVGGMEYDQADFDLSLVDKDPANSLFDEAEVRLRLDQLTWDKWAANGFLAENIEIEDEEQRIVRLMAPGARLKQLNYTMDERSMVDIKVNFLVDEVSPKNEFHLYLHQQTSETESSVQTIGTAGLHIYKEWRPDFDAEAGNNESINYGDSVTITASQINESAVYNWYNSAGELIYTGTTLTVSPEVTETYQLEIIADADGFKDYDEVEINVQPYEIIGVNPNPVSGMLTVDYSAQNAGSAYLMMVETNTSNTSNNFIIDPLQHQTVLDLSSMAPGNYTLALVCDGQIYDGINLLVQ